MKENRIKIQHSTRECLAYRPLQVLYRFRVFEYAKPTSVISVYKGLLLSEMSNFQENLFSCI